MQRLKIIGNSGAARECYWLFQDMCAADASLKTRCRFHGFLSWRNYSGDLKKLQNMFLGDALDYSINDEDIFVIGIGNPNLREDVYVTMKSRGASFFTLCHPLADINPDSNVGEANIFQRNSTVFCDVSLGNANYLNGAVNLSHDATVGDYNFVGPFSLILGNCSVGSRNLLAARTTLLPGARIGDDNIIAPSSVIYKGCRNNCRLAGNPALTIGTV
ncbi:transferase [Desulfovibrio sp.]|uniref:transferase n=1 Tax=Desulfovibrio sp. TaxID=885 RepID=UPI0025C179C1|nr:transferase [Desulfovibrio sp.]